MKLLFPTPESPTKTHLYTRLGVSTGTALDTDDMLSWSVMKGEENDNYIVKKRQLIIILIVLWNLGQRRAL